jgi:hypothetical protein
LCSWKENGIFWENRGIFYSTLRKYLELESASYKKEALSIRVLPLRWNISLELSFVSFDRYGDTRQSPLNLQIISWTANLCTPFMIFS